MGPPEAVFPGGWTGKRLALRIIELGGQCMMTYGIKELFVPNASFGPFSSAPPRLGGVELGAKRESFRGMKLVDELDGTSWYEPKKKAFDSLPLDELTYAFHDGTLGHIGFGSSDLEVCKQLLARFKATFGASDKLRNYSGGMSYTWRGEGDKYTFKFNQFRKKCSGILLAGKSPF